MAIQTQGASTPSLVKGARAVRTTIALKILMAASGIIFVLFVLLHMYGNLKAFEGQSAYNTYAEGLRTLGEPELPYGGALWIIRAVLIVSLIVHVVCALLLARRARAARPVKYQVKKHTGAIPASRLMRWGGLTLLLFIIWHLLEFTIVKVNVGSGGQSANITQNPYLLLVHAFNVWWLTAIYLVAMAMLGAHLHHGIWSSMQTLGATNSARSRRTAKQVAFTLAVIIAGGFSLVPIFTAAGVIK
ncbi:MAG: succinate dehydrogenase cytochrome b subunit [Marmoricola sp.]